jgi:hypothetical protein
LYVGVGYGIELRRFLGSIMQRGPLLEDDDEAHSHVAQQFSVEVRAEAAVTILIAPLTPRRGRNVMVERVAKEELARDDGVDGAVELTADARWKFECFFGITNLTWATFRLHNDIHELRMLSIEFIFVVSRACLE